MARLNSDVRSWDRAPGNQAIPVGNNFASHTLSMTYTDMHRIQEKNQIHFRDGLVAKENQYNIPFGEAMAEQRSSSNVGNYNTPYRYTGQELDPETGMYYYGARYYDPRVSLFIGVDPLADMYPGISPYAYVANNPLNNIEPDGRKPEDFVLLIAKDRAGGQGHMGAVIQDGQGNYYYVTQGAAENEGLSKMASNGVQGGMSIQAISGATTTEEAIGLAKQDGNNSPFTNQVQFFTNAETDQKIFDNITEMTDQINSGEVKYNVCSMNCTDAVERPIENATGAKLPNDMRPNKNFEKVKYMQGQIQTNINLSTGTHKVDYIPSGLNNVPTSTIPIIVPNNENN